MALRVKVQTTLSVSREFGKRPQLAVSLRKVVYLKVCILTYTITVSSTPPLGS